MHSPSRVQIPPSPRMTPALRKKRGGFVFAGPSDWLARGVCAGDLWVKGQKEGLKDKKSWSEPDLSALRCEKVWFKVVGGQL